MVGRVVGEASETKDVTASNLVVVKETSASVQQNGSGSESGRDGSGVTVRIGMVKELTASASHSQTHRKQFLCTHKIECVHS